MNALTDLSGFMPTVATVLVPLITGASGWLIARTGKKADVQSAINGAMTSLIATYQSTLEAERLHRDGPAIGLSPENTLHLALVLHELGTNAAKYGALSRAEGEVHLHWRVDAGGLRVMAGIQA